MITAPMEYTPSFCDSVREGCDRSISLINEKINRVDSRMWALIMLAGSNLLASIGGLIFYIVTQMNNEEIIKSLVR